MDGPTNKLGRSIFGAMDGFLTGAAAMLHAAFDMRAGARQIRENASATLDGANVTMRELQTLATAADGVAAEMGTIRQRVQSGASTVHGALRRAAGQDAGPNIGLSGAEIAELARLIADVAAVTERQAAATADLAGKVRAAIKDTQTYADTLRDMLEVAATTDAKSANALQAANEIGRLADTLYKDVSALLPPPPPGDTTKQRIHERLQTLGFQATLRMPGAADVQARIIDISRGGIGLAMRCNCPVGTDVEIGLPSGGVVRARVARIADGITGFTIPQDAETHAHVERALHLLILSGAGQAA